MLSKASIKEERSMRTMKLNSKDALRKAVCALPDDYEIGMVLGLDGDCDFAVRVTDYYAYRSEKRDLMSLIDEQPEGRLPFMFKNRDYLVLSRRHAVYLPDIQTAAVQAVAM